MLYHSQMDGVSAAASVLQVIDLTVNVASICGVYILKVKRAKDDIRALQQEIRSLARVLQKLEELLNSPNGTKLSTSRTLCDDLANYGSLLQALEEKIDPERQKKKPMARFGLRALEWPLKRAELESALQDLEKYKSTFAFSLQVDQMYVFLPF